MEQYKVLFLDEKAFTWCKGDDTAVKGYGWYQGQYLDSKDLLHIFVLAETQENLICTIKNLNGSFAGYKKIKNEWFLFVDHIRSIPLFYDTYHKIIADQTKFIIPEHYELDEIAAAELIKSTMYVCNDRTFAKSVKQVMAGEIIKLNDNDYSSERINYYRHLHTEANLKKNMNNYFDEIENLSISVFSRLVDSLNGQTAIIPLSGGYDSRYIAAMLKKLNYQNVVCFTYGFSNDTNETGISKKVADALGYPHYFAEITPKMWKHFFQDSEVADFLNYDDFDSNLPHVQEIMALQELRKDPCFPKNGIVLPGFSGDILGGSYTLSLNQNKVYQYNDELFIDFIYNHHFYIQPQYFSYNKEIRNDIRDYLHKRQCRIYDLVTFNSEYEEWFAIHKQAVFILSCLKTYEYYGYTWRIPLWDKELIEYWYKIPMVMKQSGSLYDVSLRELLFKPMGIDFEKANKSRRQIEPYRRGMVKTILYGLIMYVYYHTSILLYFKKDSNNFNYFCRLCYLNMKNRKAIRFHLIVLFETTTLWWLEKKLSPEQLKGLLNKR